MQHFLCRAQRARKVASKFQIRNLVDFFDGQSIKLAKLRDSDPDFSIEKVSQSPLKSLPMTDFESRKMLSRVQPMSDFFASRYAYEGHMYKDAQKIRSDGLPKKGTSQLLQSPPRSLSPTSCSAIPTGSTSRPCATWRPTPTPSTTG